MRLKINKSAHSKSFSVIKSAYINNKRTSVIVETLGNEDYIRKTYGVDDAEAWARDYVKQLNQNAAESKSETTITFHPDKSIDPDVQRHYNGGYLFLQQIYYELGLDRICKAVKTKHSFDYNLNSVLSRLLYARIIYPSSKLSSFEQSKCFIESPDFNLQDIYKALSVIAKDSDYIQSSLYKNSLALSPRKTGIIYYDCTNFFFETEDTQDGSLKQYGFSKEHRPNPIVQMGLFMDRDGIPLAFCINPGNTNEQQTLRPLEETLLEDFSLSKFVVCTDAGLSSLANRKFNDKDDRAFITTQSLKNIKKHLQDWAIDPSGWRLKGGASAFHLNELDEKLYHDCVFYKERWVNENGLEQHLIISYSIKDRNYQRTVRNKQIKRAQDLLDSGKGKELNHRKQTDYKRFLTMKTCTDDGEIASKKIYELNQDALETEERFDGFYAVCTNLEADAADIISINQKRWEIEECFRIMKTEFKSRPVYLQRDDRIKAHFMICFIALTIFRYLEKKLDHKYTVSEIVGALRTMDFVKFEGHGFIPAYDNTEIIQKLHHIFGFDTAKEIVSITDMKKICSQTKKKP